MKTLIDQLSTYAAHHRDLVTHPIGIVALSPARVVAITRGNVFTAARRLDGHPDRDRDPH